ncbi:hypothetical protein BCR32DRAFT_233521 [Anaeromyces robustus]|uniref:ABC transporter domain-containing protein n=1 Tax=Anaeromyces robustus TaxID=1754192 RepID=A0A1Y1X2W9_9FUNG|nr:hypothetical protein BCR32DRAFT_233521 [Anaeromyces robustus]|eukprot:ORX80159.1 hypothetical protein BCR32DRAFT_233521 [Anaeromyces robustus]
MEEYRKRQDAFGVSYEGSVSGKRYCNENDTRELLDISYGTTRTEGESIKVTKILTNNSLPPPEHRKSYQFRAMFRKTLSYQKRQIGTNLGCVIACPTVFILVTFGLALFIESLSQDVFQKNIYEYCSNEFNGTFVLPLDPESYKKDNPNIILAHYDQGFNPCSVWFGTNDYFASAPYDIIPENSTDRIHRDTLFIPPVNASGNYAYFFNKLADTTGLGDMESMKETLKLQEQFKSGDMSGMQDEMIRNMLKSYGIPDDQLDEIMKKYKETGQLPLEELMGGMAGMGGMGGMGGMAGADPTEMIKSELKKSGLTDDQINLILENYKKTGQIDMSVLGQGVGGGNANPGQDDIKNLIIQSIKNKELPDELKQAIQSNQINDSYLNDLVKSGDISEQDLTEYKSKFFGTGSGSGSSSGSGSGSGSGSNTGSNSDGKGKASTVPTPRKNSGSGSTPTIHVSGNTKDLQKRASSTTTKKSTSTKKTKTKTTTTTTTTPTETGDTKESIYNQSKIFFMLSNMMRPWGIFAVSNTTEKEIIGKHPRESANITLINIEDDKYELSNKGILDYSYTRYFLNMYDLVRNDTPSVNFERLPFFEFVDINNEEDLDVELNNRIKVVNKILKNTTFSDYTNDEKKYVTLSNFKNTEDAIVKSVDYMPYGAMLINSIEENENNYKYDMLLSVGENTRLSYIFGLKGNNVNPYMSYPGKGKRLLYFITEFNSAWLRKITDNKSTITQGFRSYPVFKENNKYNYNIDASDLVGVFLYPWGISFLIPVFVMSLVKDKEERYVVMMKMNGMKPIVYYVFTYITDLILCLVSLLCFNIAGYLCKMKLFIQTSPEVLLLLFFVWANVLVMFSFAVSFFFKRNSTALVTTFLIVMFSVILCFALQSEMKTTNKYFLWPLIAFYYIINKLSATPKEGERMYYQLKDFVPGDRIFTVTMMLIVEFFVLLILVYYFSTVIPQEYGNHKPWHLNIFKCFKRKRNIDDFDLNNSNNPFYNSKEQEDAEILEDDDVKAERKRVLTGQYDSDCPLVIKNFRKEYAPRIKGDSPHVAVRSATFAVENSKVFGLLGPNGAGKTTLIHSLIGVYPPTAGYARVAGYNIETDMNQVYKRIGICPQHDILWNDLTVEEHLLFYARLKGITKSQEETAINDSLSSVGLTAFRKNLVKGLSGGEKRRLSIAIALVGDPKIVFLDEPTTGLDPDVRRLIWDILNEISQEKTIILTTHSMEEAEVLCHRIAIMSHGTIRCCNTSLRLKEIYGAGFRLTYNNDPQKYKELKQFITNTLPENHKAIRDLASNSIYEFIPDQGYVSQLFKIIEQNKEQYGIINWGISQSSLEEVFLSIISEGDADGH